MSAPVTVLEDGKPVRIDLPGGGFVEVGEDGDWWCIACEALDPKPWRFTEEQAELVFWTICGDHEELNASFM